MTGHPDPRALAGRVLADAELDPDALRISRGDLEPLVAAAFAFGAAAGLAAAAGLRCCRVCGCTRYRACPGSCFWVGRDLCSSCQPFVAQPFLEGDPLR